jgi:hypothetical protein
MGRIDQTSKKHHFGFALQPRRTRKMLQDFRQLVDQALPVLICWVASG